MFRTTSLTGSSTILQSLIDRADEDEIGENKSGCNKTNLSNLFTSKKSTRAGYLIFKSVKKGGCNIKKYVKDARGSNYLIPDAKKAFNVLRHMLTQAFILQYSDPNRHLGIETNASGYAIGGTLSQLTLDNLSQ